MSWPALLFTPWSRDVAYAVPAVVGIFGLAAAPQGWLARALTRPTLILLGEASYAFYLVHVAVLIGLGGGQWALDGSPWSFAREGSIFALVLALAVGLHLAFERPARSYLKRVLTRSARGERRSVAPGARAEYAREGSER